MMKAAVCYEYGKPLVIEDVELAPPQKNEVKVRLAATAICHSDIHFINGDVGFPVPFVPGHESAGYVEEIGEGVTLVKPGDAVVVSCLASCGKCKYCAAGLPQLCVAQWPLDKESRLRNKKGQVLAHMTRTATFAEYAIINEGQIALIDKDMPMDRACLLSCGVLTGFGAVVNRAQVKPFHSAVIIGFGGVGASSVQGAALSGAYPVIVVDVIDSKLKDAAVFGATHTINAKKTDAIAAVKELTGGGADYVFVTVGSTDAIKQGLTMCGPRGMTVVVGVVPIDKLVSISPHEFLLGCEKILTGSYMGSSQLRYDVQNLTRLYKLGKLKLDEMITKRYRLEQINEAIETVIKGQALRNVIMFDSTKKIPFLTKTIKPAFRTKRRFYFNINFSDYWYARPVGRPSLFPVSGIKFHTVERREENSAGIIAGDHVFYYHIGNRRLGVHNKDSVVANTKAIDKV
jgi:S-(hydroxymethyl)glutathione dehydrogenase / alcohol dehydrogenase